PLRPGRAHRRACDHPRGIPPFQVTAPILAPSSPSRYARLRSTGGGAEVVRPADEMPSGRTRVRIQRKLCEQSAPPVIREPPTIGTTMYSEMDMRFYLAQPPGALHSYVTTSTRGVTHRPSSPRQRRP